MLMRWSDWKVGSLAAISLAIFPIVSTAADAIHTTSWPEFRGTNAAGLSARDQAYPVEFSSNDKMQWRTAVPMGHSSPAVWGDHIFLTAFDEAAQELQVVCLDREKGLIEWTRKVQAEEIEKVHSISNPATGTPVVDGERVIAYFGSAGLFAFSFTGEQVWSIPMPVAKIGFGSGNSPMLVGDWVILCREGSEQYILAVDRKTGQTAWKESLQFRDRRRGGGHASPILWKDQIVLHRGGEVLGLDVRTGKRRWWLPIPSQGNSTPVAGQELIYVSGWNNFGEPDLIRKLPDFETVLQSSDQDEDGSLSEEEFPDGLAVSARIDAGDVPGAIMKTRKGFFGFFDQGKDGRIDRDEWTQRAEEMGQVRRAHGLLAVRPNGEGELPPDAVIWRENRAVSEIPSPLLYRNKVYMVTNGGIVTCMDPRTGELFFRARLGAPGLYYASPVASGGKIYFASGEGIVSVISDTTEMEVLARNDLGESIFATPALVDGHVYVRTTQHLYAFQDHEQD